MRLYEKYRPASLDAVVGQDKAVALIHKLIARDGQRGAAFWISGPSGSGKTTLARILARSVDPCGARIHEYRTADDLTAGEVDAIDDAYQVCRRGLFSLPQAIIVNEAHGLNSRQVRTLLGLLEGIPESFVWVFTTTWDGDSWLEDSAIDAAPLKSRCFPIRLTNQGTAEAFAARALEIARAEGMDGQPLPEYVKLARKHKNNFRAMLIDIEAGAMLE